MGVVVVRNKTNDIKIDFPWHSLINHILFADDDVILRYMKPTMSNQSSFSEVRKSRRSMTNKLKMTMK